MILKINEEVNSGELPATPISPLQFDLIQETTTRVHVKVTDPNNKRWEIPER